MPSTGMFGPRGGRASRPRLGRWRAWPHSRCRAEAPVHTAATLAGSLALRPMSAHAQTTTAIRRAPDRLRGACTLLEVQAAALLHHLGRVAVADVAEENLDLTRAVADTRRPPCHCRTGHAAHSRHPRARASMKSRRLQRAVAERVDLGHAGFSSRSSRPLGAVAERLFYGIHLETAVCVADDSP